MFSRVGGAGKASGAGTAGLIGGGVEKWAHWFSFAVLRLGLSPAAFWALGLSEWRWLLEAALGGGEALDGAALKSLTRQYPDERS